MALICFGVLASAGSTPAIQRPRQPDNVKASPLRVCAQPVNEAMQ